MYRTFFVLHAPVYAGTVPAGAPNTAPTAAAHARSAPAARVDKSGTGTTLRGQRLANYKARLKQEGSVSQLPNGVAGASAPHGIEHGQMVYLVADSASNRFRVGETVSPWTRHQERDHRLSACPEQPSVGGHYMSESIPRISTQSVLRYDETLDDDNYQPGFHAQSYFGTHEPSLAHPDVTRGCQERLSHRDCTRHLPGLCLLPCRGMEIWAFHINPLWTESLSDLIPNCVWLKCRTSKVMGGGGSGL